MAYKIKGKKIYGIVLLYSEDDDQPLEIEFYLDKKNAEKAVRKYNEEIVKGILIEDDHDEAVLIKNIKEMSDTELLEIIDDTEEHWELMHESVLMDLPIVHIPSQWQEKDQGKGEWTTTACSTGDFKKDGYGIYESGKED